jgi:thiol:disulfide interchange protein DsbD
MAIFSSVSFGSEILIDPVAVTLVASIDSIMPGRPFQVGVMFRIDPGWHIYWKYSGDAGLPPDIRWNLPPGWTAGPIAWPTPERFTEKGPLTTYGYRDSVLLMAELTVPESPAAAARSAIEAKINWMVCREECIPGKTIVRLELPLHSRAVPGNGSKTSSENRLICGRRDYR